VPLLFLIMTEQHQDRHHDWLALLQRIQLEIGALCDYERTWLNERLAVIASLQRALDELFNIAGGKDSCGRCNGACCGCGRHHITLTNLLGYLLAGEIPPSPDFNQTCPFLSEHGCCLQVARRPYNCITFFCETLEDRLDPGQRVQLRALDCQLRNQYQQVAERYPAASLRGLWIALERVGNGQLLRSTIHKDMLE
jgi:hypothetical protein